MYEHRDGITLRKMEWSDISKLLALKEESWRSTHKVAIINLEDQRRWMENLPQGSLIMMAEWAMAESSPDKPLVSEDRKVRAKIKLKADGKTFALREAIGVAVYTDIDHLSRTCKISGSVFRQHRKPEIIQAGFAAGVDFAFEMLNMHRIESEVIAYHAASQKLQFDLGFRLEGKKSQSVYKCGRYYDSLMLGLLRSEWEQTPRIRSYKDTCNNNFSRNKAVELEEVAYSNEIMTEHLKWLTEMQAGRQ